MSTPRRSRPGFGPSYGISPDEEGMLGWGWADSRLSAARKRPAEGWYRLRPRQALAWLERDYPKTAAHFDFG